VAGDDANLWRDAVVASLVRGSENNRWPVRGNARPLSMKAGPPGYIKLATVPHVLFCRYCLIGPKNFTGDRL